MANWNWALRDRYLQAARILGYAVECNWNYYKMQIPGDVYCYLWHPLNKMRYLDLEGSPDQALRHIKDNQDDFHIEIDRRGAPGISYLFMELYEDPTIEQIVDCVREAHDALALDRREVFAALLYTEAAE